ncbi:glutamine synthetase family protein [Treponema sp.]|uniref:glutamine synthetase family protein n=1 Tax=Treponema sp. TaxID=166 RepID=UPI0025DC1670|nr:glutamine synthetase family protein [Treponema sp.]MCR5218730.1 glutamine synthetase family protein [Treponema sp.]
MEYSKSEVLQYVAENDVKFIKLFFTDIVGEVRSLTIQPSILRTAFERGISFDGSAVPGFMNVEQSDLLLVPDPTTLSVLPWRPSHGRVARMYCNICNPDGSPFAGDSRLILQKSIDKVQKAGLEIKVGTECEFYLFRLDEIGQPSDVPHDRAGYCGLAPLDKGENVRRDIIMNLEQMGIEPQTSHHEAGPGQNEIDFKYSSPLKAADNFATFKITVKTVAAKDGLWATFQPKPLQNEAGSGLHLNISIYKDGANLFGRESPEARQFIAGILNRIKEITAFLNPLEQSYSRLGAFEAPSYVSWSCQNRSQLIRIPAATGDSFRMELRSPDPACNQYLALSLVIEAGLEGIEKKMELMPSCDKNLFEITEKEVAALGIEKLPASLNDAIELAKKSQFVKDIIPEVTLNAFFKMAGLKRDPSAI